jgi:hypothetical protein
MKWRTLLFPVVAVFAFAPQTAHSQTLVGTYYRCSTADEGEADFIMNTVLSEIFDRHADAGDISGWGWVEHQAGGAWRRIQTITAPDRSTVLNMWGQIIEEIEDEHPNAWHRFNEICDAHDDYIWNLVAASEGNDPGVTPDAWVSTYWVCNERTESRADELMQQMGPVVDQHIAAGHLGGWGWYAHDIGGRFRRLMTLQAAADFDVLEGREMVINDLQSNHAELLDEFSSICGAHVDYLWANGRAGDDD